LKERLNPSKPGRKGVVLCGLGGSGKTQIVLRYIEENKELYSAILWIDASSTEMIDHSFSEVLALVIDTWPEKDLPLPYRGKSKTCKVTSRLRSTLHRKWLLVLDGCNQPLAVLEELVPACQHGSVLVSSTKRQVAEIFEAMGFCSVAVDGLDAESGKRLLVATAGTNLSSVESNEYSVEGMSILSHPFRSVRSDLSIETALLRGIVKELNYLPLALEQAGGLLRKGIVSLPSFVRDYRSYYSTLMDRAPPRGVIEYDKSILMVLSMLYSYVEKDSPEAAALLTFLGILGHWAIPFSTLRRMGDIETNLCLNLGKEIEALRRVLADEIILRLRLSQLEDIFLLRISRGSLSRGSISLHPAITQWVQQMVVSDKPSWVVYASMALTKNFFTDLS
jgi:hypothetical protein